MTKLLKIFVAKLLQVSLTCFVIAFLIVAKPGIIFPIPIVILFNTTIIQLRVHISLFSTHNINHLKNVLKKNKKKLQMHMIVINQTIATVIN